jgi:cytochrome c553
VIRFFAGFFLLLVALPASAQPPTDSESFFESKIRPIFAGTCARCHGPEKASHGLRLDSRPALLRGGESGPAIIPGDPDKSLLLQAIRHSRDDLHMPPGKRLSDAVAADFATWIRRGAPWPKITIPMSGASTPRHWAFAPVRALTPPLDPTGWSDNPIDRFISARLREQGLRPVAPADRRTLLRRVTFDLIGLPPSPEEAAAFLAGDSPGALEKVVERLLANPHYGERWGRYWLDVARYADTAGDNADYPIPEARRYRDYVIDSFNADKPYDQFVREQLAGDLLAQLEPPERYAERVTATGFLALSRRYATAPYELWPLTIEDSIETTGRAFLGLTLRCARCHDHKFDPVTQEDYYALYGIFASTQYPWAGAEELATKGFNRMHFVPLVPPKDAAPRLATHQKRVRDLEARIHLLEKDDPLARKLAALDRQIEAKTKARSGSTQPNGSDPKAELAALRQERERVEHQLQGRFPGLRMELRRLVRPGLPADLPGAHAVQEGIPLDMYIHRHGDETQHGPVAHRAVPKFLAGGHPPVIPTKSSGRLQLAEWLARPDNPLTARVMVNRIWQHHFGKGIVTTPSNFGVRGEPPTHPELLDWLAGRFIDSGWSIKAMHRLILRSKTYQLASADDDVDAAQDPGNRWYWRADRQRLDAEGIRDALLTVSGRLDRRRQGPHPFPPIESWGWTQHNPFKDTYTSNHRSIYLMTQRLKRHPFLALFDGPDTNTSTDVRPTSTVPQQALFLMNNAFVREQAEGLARRLIAASPDERQRIDLAHQLAWSRPAEATEQEAGLHYVEEYRKQLAAAGTPADRIELEAWTSYARVLLCANEFVYLD